MTREEALARIAKPEIDEETMAQEFEYVATKLGWTAAEFGGNLQRREQDVPGLQEQHVSHHARRQDFQPARA